MKRNSMVEGFLLGCGITALVLVFFGRPVLERNQNLATDMTMLYIAAINDIQDLQEVCGPSCESVKMTSLELSESILGTTD